MLYFTLKIVKKIMTKKAKIKAYKSGTPSVWDEVFEGSDVDYSDSPITQNQLFDQTKISFLKEIFPKKDRGKKVRMLEVGCGSAFVSLFFAKYGYEVDCVDINKNILKIAMNNFKKENVKGHFVAADAKKLPFKNNTFDVVTSFGLMEHFEDPLLVFKEMQRVLKPKGLFFADIVPDRFSVQTFGNIFNLIVTTVFWALKGKPALGWKKGIRNIKPLYFESNMKINEYKALMEESGITGIKVKGNRPWPRLTLPGILDKFYTLLMKPSLPLWKKFDRSGSWFSKFWGAGWWFWGSKN